MRQIFLAFAVAMVAAQPVSAKSTPVPQVVRSPAYKAAAAALDAGHDRWVADTIAITQVPAPPFKEEVRAKAFAEMLRARGLPVEIDGEGNVLALRKGSVGGPVLVVAAHLDTVFPEGTDVKVRRDGTRLRAPGVGDDSAGLATLLALIDAMAAGKVQTRHDILFVGNVGEEGPGNLRGTRFLFDKGAYKDRIGGFISLDSSGLDSVVTRGIGSERYRVIFKGPGGHSSGAFGIVNPMVALATTVTEMYKLEAPKNPRTTYSASVVGGGTSVNTIPQEVWLDVDMRSESMAALKSLERQFLAILPRAVAMENAARSTDAGKVSFELKPIGSRPAGATPESSDIMRSATAAYRAEGISVNTEASSTDANVPMNLGIPAITMAHVVEGDRAHAPDEWIDTAKAPNVKLKRILLATILAEAGAR